ncbi:pyridoxal phosphate-dependent transferase [Lasiosphaeria hispida]|uniref:Pyridoxal phosphate-dependent transferase n=1 Tax=Lasiosphaeria hispida TaxID=260671 RepID=A0AAJ0HUB8_9PEZI|nr:pyridoxal phosphate-dependent transferase [Lasiosphaeria hispida]
MPANTLNLESVRGSFPALARDQVYFDNAGGSQVLGTVAESIRDYLLNTNVQLGASYVTSKKSTQRYEEGYGAAAKYIGASDSEIVQGPSTTQLFRNISYALDFQPGDEVVISAIDHEANIAPWVGLAERQQLILKWWLPDTADPTSPKLFAEDLKGLLSNRTRLVTCTHASNILGTIHDIKAIVKAVRSGPSPDALVGVDAVAYAPHRKIDVKELGVDLYAFSWYKVYGPHMAILYATSRAQAQLRSLGHHSNPQNTLEDKLGLAAASYELVSGIPAVLEYLEGDSPKWDGIVAQESALQEMLLAYLNGRDDVTVWGERSADSAVRVSTISFTIEGWGSQDFVETVEKESRFGFRWGSFYSVRLVEEILGLGKDGIIRVSMVHYNTVDEVKGLVKVMDDVLSRGK